MYKKKKTTGHIVYLNNHKQIFLMIFQGSEDVFFACSPRPLAL